MQTPVATNIHHAVLSMLFAVRRWLSSLEVKGRLIQARVMQTPLSADVYYTVLSMLLTVLRLLASLEFEGRAYLAVLLAEMIHFHRQQARPRVFGKMSPAKRLQQLRKGRRTQLSILRLAKAHLPSFM